MIITIYSETCPKCRMSLFHNDEEHAFYGGSIFEMEENKTYEVEYKYTLPVINEDVTVKLELTYENLKAICFSEEDVFHHVVLNIRDIEQ